MDRHISLTLDDELAAIVEAQITTGRPEVAGEVLAVGPLLLQRESAELAALHAALVEGEDSGASAPFDFDTFIAERLAAEPPSP